MNVRDHLPTLPTYFYPGNFSNIYGVRGRDQNSINNEPQQPTNQDIQSKAKKGDIDVLLENFNWTLKDLIGKDLTPEQQTKLCLGLAIVLSALATGGVAYQIAALKHTTALSPALFSNCSTDDINTAKVEITELIKELRTTGIPYLGTEKYIATTYKNIKNNLHTILIQVHHHSDYMTVIDFAKEKALNTFGFMFRRQADIFITLMDQVVEELAKH